MEKTLYIDGKQVRFKSTGGTLLRYKMQFGSDFLSDISKLASIEISEEDLEDTKKKIEAIGKIDMEAMYNFIWVLAKTADKNIPEPLEWLDEFETFPIMDILPELMDLIQSSFINKKK